MPLREKHSTAPTNAIGCSCSTVASCLSRDKALNQFQANAMYNGRRTTTPTKIFSTSRIRSPSFSPSPSLLSTSFTLSFAHSLRVSSSMFAVRTLADNSNWETCFCAININVTGGHIGHNFLVNTWINISVVHWLIFVWFACRTDATIDEENKRTNVPLSQV